MEYILVLLSSIIFQYVLNVVSDKIDYEYSKKNKLIAIFINLILWMYSYNKFGLTANFWIISIVESFLISSSLIDLRYKEIPDSYNLAVGLLGGIFIYMYNPYYQELLLGGIIAFALFFTISVFTGAMGMGDVKMAGAVGLFMGTMLISKFIVYSFLIGAMVGLFLLISKKKERKDNFPFGPCIAMSAIYLFITLF